MAIFGLFDIGKTALLASQTGMRVVSNNIANANTPGYSKQEVILEIASPASARSGFMGRGVMVAGVRRHYDKFIASQLLGQRQNYGRSYSLNQALSQVEQIFNEQAGMGISGPLSDYFSAWDEVANQPDGSAQRYSLIKKAESLATYAQRMEAGILDILKNANDGIETAVEEVNGLASEIADLNAKIVQIEAGSGTAGANDLRDQRDQALDELAGLIDITTYEDANGSVTVITGMRNLVSGEITNTLSTVVNQDGDNDLYLDGMNITGSIQKGEIGGYIAVRDDIETNSLMGLRKLIASLTKEVNLLHQAGFGLDGSTTNDFFNPLSLSTSDYSTGADITATITNLSQVTLDEYDIRFDAGGNYYVYNKATGGLETSGAYVSGNPFTVNGITMTITGAVTPNDSFFVSPLTDAIQNFGVAISDPQEIAASATAAGVPGDNQNALLMAGLSGTAVAELGNSTFSAYYTGLVSMTGAMSSASSDSLTFDENLLAELSDWRDSASGVSLEEEAINLIKFQRSFEAGAKVIQAADELLQTVMNL